MASFETRFLVLLAHEIVLMNTRLNRAPCVSTEYSRLLIRFTPSNDGVYAAVLNKYFIEDAFSGAGC
jgi:hypothetical protein